MLVELDQVEFLEPVEGVEERELRFVLPLRGSATQVLDEDAWVDLLLHVDRRRISNQVGRVGWVVARKLALPDELRVQRRVTRDDDVACLLDLRRDQLLRIGRWQVRALVTVLQRVDRDRTGRLLSAGRHTAISPSGDRAGRGRR